MEGFETPAAALAEDQLRLAQARWLLPVDPPLGWTQLGRVLTLNEHRLRYPSRPLTVPSFDPAELVALIQKLARISHTAEVHRGSESVKVVLRQRLA